MTTAVGSDALPHFPFFLFHSVQSLFSFSLFPYWIVFLELARCCSSLVCYHWSSRDGGIVRCVQKVERLWPIVWECNRYRRQVRVWLLRCVWDTHKLPLQGCDRVGVTSWGERPCSLVVTSWDTEEVLVISGSVECVCYWSVLLGEREMIVEKSTQSSLSRSIHCIKLSVFTSNILFMCMVVKRLHTHIQCLWEGSVKKRLCTWQSILPCGLFLTMSHPSGFHEVPCVSYSTLL